MKCRTEKNIINSACWVQLVGAGHTRNGLLKKVMHEPGGAGFAPVKPVRGHHTGPELLICILRRMPMVLSTHKGQLCI